MQKTIGTKREENDIYYFDDHDDSSAIPSTVCPAVASVHQIHCRLGHPCLSNLKLLVPNLSHLSSLECKSCQLGPISSVRRYSFRDIKSATDGFRRIIDNYCNAAAYKAKFQNGHVALVKEIRGFHDNDDVFYREVQLLGSLHHRHVVALSGFSAGQKRFLVFENIENGSLKEHLNDPLRTPLTWTTRLQIAVGVAAALEYLHFFCDPPIYHVSISSSTIMLDENFNAKLSDIGLLGTGENNVREPHSSCFEERRKQISRGMMFQLGVLILELITGQSSEDGGVELIKWVNFPGSIHNMLDPDLGDNYDSTELKSLLAVARLCIKSADKPAIFIQHILWYLQKKIGITRNMYR